MWIIVILENFSDHRIMDTMSNYYFHNQEALDVSLV